MTDESSNAKLRETTAVFLVGDIAWTMRWYQANLAFDAEVFPESPPHAFCILRKDDVEIFLQQLDGYQMPDFYDQREGGVWSVYIRTEGVHGLFQALSKLTEVQVLEPLCLQPYGETEFVVRDPNGYILVFAERL
ncbi:MAG: VOC family protein [Gemmatimonadaceae bacterium]